MNKKIKGYEVMKLIAEKQIKSGTKFKDLTDNNYADDSNIYRYENNNFIGRWGGTNILLLLKHDFEILEDEEEIDIEEIGELPEDFDASFYDKHSIKANRYKINEILRAVKQLDKEINKEYCQNCGDELTENNKYMNGMCMECKCGIDWKDKED